MVKVSPIWPCEESDSERELRFMDELIVKGWMGARTTSRAVAVLINRATAMLNR